MYLGEGKPSVGLIWAQFSAYHVDRLEAVGRRLDGRANVLAVEVTSKSSTYAWDPSGDVRNTTKKRLFAGEIYEKIPWWKRLRRQFGALRRCDIVFIGVPYSMPDIVLLSLVLRLMGKTVVMMTASKFDDFERTATTEMLKSLLLRTYSAAIVGGRRQYEYVRFLGFRNRPVLPGYNTVSMDRVRHQASVRGTAQVAFADRAFIYVGRFVEKKNLETMLEAYALYARGAGSGARPLDMIGDGALKPALVERSRALGISDLVRFVGFLSAEAVSARLAGGLALVLVSGEEQWGLVVNEALAVGLPIIASTEIGAREALVRNLINGFIVESGAVESIAFAFARLTDEATWDRFSAHSHERAWLADSERFADAVELLVFPRSERARADHDRFAAAILIDPTRELRRNP